MKYYCLRREIGPWVYKGLADDYYDITGPKTVTNLTREGPALEEPILPEPMFMHKAKMKDLQNIVVLGDRFLTINAKFLELLLQFVKEPYQIWPIKVHHRKQVLPYHVFHLSYPERDRIDYSSSLFYEGRDMDYSRTWVGNKVEISSLEDFYHKNSLLAQEPDPERRLVVRSHKLTVDFRGLTSHLIRFERKSLLTTCNFVSEELKQAIEDAKLTGCRFVDPSEDDQRIVAIFD